MSPLMDYFTKCGIKITMSSKVIGNECQLTFGASEDLAEIKQEGEDSIEMTIESDQNLKEEIIDTQIPELSRKRPNDSSKWTDSNEDVPLKKKKRKNQLKEIGASNFSDPLDEYDLDLSEDFLS